MLQAANFRQSRAHQSACGIEGARIVVWWFAACSDGGLTHHRHITAAQLAGTPGACRILARMACGVRWTSLGTGLKAGRPKKHERGLHPFLRMPTTTLQAGMVGHGAQVQCACCNARLCSRYACPCGGFHTAAFSACANWSKRWLLTSPFVLPTSPLQMRTLQLQCVGLTNAYTPFGKNSQQCSSGESVLMTAAASI